MKERISVIKNKIQTEACSCVVVTEKGEWIEKNGRGIGPLIRMHEAGFTSCMAGDKIIGKAAAMILVLMQATYVYGQVMAKSAAKLFEDRGILFEYGVLTEEIENREGTGLCPMEQAVLHLEDPKEGILAVKNKLKELRGHAK